MSSSDTLETIQMRAFVLWTAIERDLTEILVSKIAEQFFDLGYIAKWEEDQDGKAILVHSTINEQALNFSIVRMNSDISIDETYPEAVKELPNYLTFPDKLKVLLSNRALLEDSEEKAVRDTQELHTVSLVRNKEAHPGTLKVLVTNEQYQELLHDCVNLVTNHPGILKQLENKIDWLETGPSYQEMVGVSGGELQESLMEERLLHSNVPPKHYLDTGFLFREKILRNLLEDVTEGIPLITVYGEGGIGKTTIVRELIDRLVGNYPEHTDVIWWHSSKLEEFTEGEIKTTGLEAKPLAEVSNRLHEETGINLDSDKKDEDIKVLLVLDNLETELTANKDETIKFIKKHITKCQIIITTRLRLGELESPVQIPAFDNKESAQYLRKLALSKNYQPLIEESEEDLKKHAKKLENNPLMLRWFFENRLQGLEPSQIFRKSGDIINFMFSNIYNNLNPDSRELLSTLRIANKPITKFLAKHLMEDWDDDRFNEARINLESSSLIQTTTSRGAFSYGVSLIAKRFLSANQVQDANYEKVIAKIKEIESFQYDMRQAHGLDFFDYRYFPEKEREENRLIVGELIKLQLKISRFEKGQDSEVEVDSKALLDLEVSIRDKLDKLIKDGAEYSPIYRVYGVFLSEQLKNYDEAITKFTDGLQLYNSQEEEIQLLYYLARTYQKIGASEALNASERVWSTFRHARTAYLYSSVLSDKGDLKAALDVAKEGIKVEEEREQQDERELQRIMGGYLRVLYFMVSVREDSKQKRKETIENEFSYLSEKFDFIHIDQLSLEEVLRIISVYISICSDYFLTDQSTFPLSIKKLFSQKKYYISTWQKNYIHKMIRSHYEDASNTIIKRLEIPAREQKKLEGIATITKINQHEGYGYLKSQEHGKLYFRDVSCVSSKIKFFELKEGDELSFEANPPRIVKKKNKDGSKTKKMNRVPEVYRFININPKNS